MKKFFSKIGKEVSLEYQIFLKNIQLLLCSIKEMIENM